LIENPSDLILASSSQVRSKLLKNAGIKFSVYPAEIDETKIKNDSVSVPVDKLTNNLAATKAGVVSNRFKNKIIIGADQILECEGEIFDKPLEKSVARQNLLKLRGKTHQLISSVCVAEDGEIIWSNTDIAKLTMLNLSDDNIDRYLTLAGSSVYSSVGAYRLEDIGIQLFKEIEGDYFTILGLPLLPLLDFLRTRCALKV